MPKEEYQYRVSHVQIAFAQRAGNARFLLN